MSSFTTFELMRSLPHMQVWRGKGSGGEGSGGGRGGRGRRGEATKPMLVRFESVRLCVQLNSMQTEHPHRCMMSQAV